MSPILSGPFTTPTFDTEESNWANSSLSVLTKSVKTTAFPHATLKTSPNASGLVVVPASSLAKITLSTCVKSLDCKPSPCIVGASPEANLLMNLGIAAA